MAVYEGKERYRSAVIMLCHLIFLYSFGPGLPHEPERHAQYVGSWIKTLQNDPNELRYAARDAAKMADYMLQYDREKPREVTEAPREAGSTAPSPERQIAARQEPEKQPEQTPEVTMSR